MILDMTVECECELRAVIESHGTLHQWATAGWDSDAMAMHEVLRSVESAPRDLQRRVQALATSEVTDDWVPLAGRRHCRNVTAQAIGAKIAEDAVVVQGS